LRRALISIFVAFAAVLSSAAPVSADTDATASAIVPHHAVDRGLADRLLALGLTELRKPLVVPKSRSIIPAQATVQCSDPVMTCCCAVAEQASCLDPTSCRQLNGMCITSAPPPPSVDCH
jgi:hypothetical protein